MVGGSDKKTTLCTREAVKLKDVLRHRRVGLVDRCEASAVRRSPSVLMVAPIQLWDVEIEPIYALDGDRFAVREHMTDVVVHHMHVEKRVRIKSRDYVRKVAIYRDRLAIQLPDRINVRELHKRDDSSSGYALSTAEGAAEGGWVENASFRLPHNMSSSRLVAS